MTIISNQFKSPTTKKYDAARDELSDLKCGTVRYAGKQLEIQNLLKIIEGEAKRESDQAICAASGIATPTERAEALTVRELRQLLFEIEDQDRCVSFGGDGICGDMITKVDAGKTYCNFVYVR